MWRAVLLLGALGLAAAVALVGTPDAGEDRLSVGSPGPTPEVPSPGARALRGAGARDPAIEATDLASLDRLAAGASCRDPEAIRRLSVVAAREHEAALSYARVLVERLRPGRHVSHLGSSEPALRALGRVGAHALGEALADDDPGFVRRVAAILGTLGDAAVGEVPALIDLAKRGSGAVQPAAIHALVNLGRRADAFAPTLLAWARDPDTPPELAGLTALALLPVCGASPESLDAARSLLRRPDLAGTALLPGLAADPGAATALAPELRSMLDLVPGDSDGERELLEALGAAATGDTEARLALVRILEREDRDDAVRSQAAWLVARSGAEGRATLRRLAEAGPEPLRVLAYDAFTSGDGRHGGGPPSEEDAALLLPLLSSDDDARVDDALYRLAPWLRGEGAALVRRAIGVRLREGTTDQRAAALATLALQPEPSSDALQDGLRWLSDPRPRVRAAAAAVVAHHATGTEESGLRALEAALGDEDASVRAEAMKGLAPFEGRFRERVVRALERLAADPDPWFRTVAGDALVRLRGS